ncbi:MAG: hypothetical protein ACOY3J_01470 [Bacillota bacterium]|uniref:ATP-binding cassette domain-containing protein n=1 Tax=Thermanaerosceptrum fracticalcis TaxID=1712410 RepID=A0A7G6E3Z7_THEFR|nr:hypothetical protein [Thermanaerosceptrum fracticalcis]QNB46801.1 hypothetical protein BR63_11060 [Thermanaerosceptrum fracticalcis]
MKIYTRYPGISAAAGGSIVFPMEIKNHTVDGCGELLVYGISIKESEKRIQAALERVGLREAGYRKEAEYSRGMRQRLGIADFLSSLPLQKLNIFLEYRKAPLLALN